MPWTKQQLALAHIAKQQLSWGDPQYRLVLQNVAGIRRWCGKISSKNPSADNAGFERFMAFCEQQGFVDSKNGHGYWTAEARKQQARIHYKINELARRAHEAGLIREHWQQALASFVERQTHSRPIEEGGPTRKLEECDAVWSFKVLEGLKGWLFREAKNAGIRFDLDARIRKPAA